MCTRLSSVVPCAEEQMLEESWARAAVEGFSAAAEGFSPTSLLAHWIGPE